MPRSTIAESYGKCIWAGPVKYARVYHSHDYVMWQRRRDFAGVIKIPDLLTLS